MASGKFNSNKTGHNQNSRRTAESRTAKWKEEYGVPSASLRSERIICRRAPVDREI